RIDEPVSLGQPVDETAVEARDVAGHALDLGIRHRLDDDAVAGPVVAEAADIIGEGGKRQSDQKKGGDCCVTHVDPSALGKMAKHTPLPTLPLKREGTLPSVPPHLGAGSGRGVTPAPFLDYGNHALASSATGKSASNSAAATDASSAPRSR